MNKARILTLLSALFLVAGMTIRGATVFWTNTTSGSWDTAVNWKPNQIPGTNDIAVITNSGVTVALNSSTIAGGLHSAPMAWAQ